MHGSTSGWGRHSSGGCGGGGGGMGDNPSAASACASTTATGRLRLRSGRKTQGQQSRGTIGHRP
eukprot:scaffold1112_cov116-Isochrysis_galbana.AAC.42